MLELGTRILVREHVAVVRMGFSTGMTDGNQPGRDDDAEPVKTGPIMQ
jgi:hypothetical protein